MSEKGDEGKAGDKIHAPFTPRAVERLNRWQQAGTVHPFTCGNENCREVLEAHTEGWLCPKCFYTQDWAHAFMLNEPPKRLT